VNTSCQSRVFVGTGRGATSKFQRRVRTLARRESRRLSDSSVNKPEGKKLDTRLGLP